MTDNKCDIRKMKPLDALQLAAMVLVGALVPLWWRGGLWVAILLALVSVAKLFADIRGTGRPLCNPALDRRMRAALWAAVAYVAIYAVSLLYSNNMDAGLKVLGHKAVLLIFPLCFLFTDTSYLRPAHVRAIFYALLIAVCAVFLYDVGAAVSKMLGGASLKTVTGSTFDSRHHTYAALYALVALVFAYFELSGRWGAMRPWHRLLLLVAVAFGILYVVLVNSRSGIIGLYVMEVLCAAHLALSRRRRWQALVAALLLVGFTASAEALLPGHKNRVMGTIEAGESDARVGILKSSLKLAMQSPVVGQGAGDYAETLGEQYANDDRAFADKAFNAHNQYAESLLAVGVVGLLLLLGYLLLPLACAIGRRKVFWQVLFFTGIVMFNLLFESMLERQMGMLFIGFFLALMVLITSMDENKFCRMAKK